MNTRASDWSAMGDPRTLSPTYQSQHPLWPLQDCAVCDTCSGQDPCCMQLASQTSQSRHHMQLASWTGWTMRLVWRASRTTANACMVCILGLTHRASLANIRLVTYKTEVTSGAGKRDSRSRIQPMDHSFDTPLLNTNNWYQHNHGI